MWKHIMVAYARCNDSKEIDCQWSALRNAAEETEVPQISSLSTLSTANLKFIWDALKGPT